MSEPAFKYDFYRKEWPWTSLLWSCAGVDKELLRHCPRSEWAKYEGIGGVVLATAVLAFFSGSYGFYTVFAPKVDTALAGAQQGVHWPSVLIAFVAGIVWSLVIFNLDRFVVSSGGKGDGTEKITRQELIGASPRLFLAIMIGITLAKPLEIRIMESEIEAQLELEQQTYLQELNDNATALVEEKKQELLDRMDKGQARMDERRVYFEKRRKEILEQRRQLELEAEGKSGTGAAGRGPAWRDKKDNLDRLEADLERDKIEDKERMQPVMDDIARWKAGLVELDEQLEAQKRANVRQANNLDGLMKRIAIAEHVSPWGSRALTLLLLAIECAPIMFKMMLKTGAYDVLSENLKLQAVARAGVEMKPLHLQKGGDVLEYDPERFHAYKAALEREQRRLEVERELTEKALAAYQKKVEGEIEDNPEPFFEDKA